MSWYFFTMTGKEKWRRHLADHREQVLEDERPEFVTVLDVNHPLDDGDVPDNLFYRGPLYFDWDGENGIQDLLDDVKRFMNQLESWGFDLNQASWWLSGKKGIHCTIPMACCFDKKICDAGVKDLFKVYGRFAWENATTYMDMRVYSGRKGRMWRTTCRGREVNGYTTYKTPISPQHLRQLDEAGYWAWCRERREPVKPTPPELCLHLVTEMQVWLGKIQEDAKKRSKVKVNREIFQGWEETPPTIQAAFNGQAVNMETNLNDIALQFATAAIALGLGEDDTGKYLAMCEGFISARIQMQGTAHRTRQQVTDRLTQAFHYCLGTNAYVYIPELFASVLEPAAQGALDLRGVRSGADREKMAQISRQLQAGMIVDEVAVYKESKENLDAVADYSWVPGSVKVVRTPDGRITHYVAAAVMAGETVPEHLIPIELLTSPKDFTRYLVERGASTTIASGAQLAALRKSLMNYAAGEGVSDTLATKQEGLYFEATKDPEDGEYEGAMYWVEPSATVASLKHQKPDVAAPKYLDMFNPDGQFGVDLSRAYSVADHKGTCRDVIHHLLELNGDHYSLAVMLGWFTGCTVKHLLYNLKRIKNFPVLQIVGQAGCGKTTTANILLKLFTWRQEFRINIAGRNLTAFALSSLATASTTIPVVIDEVKPQNLGAQYMADFRGFIQTIYTIGSEAKRGGGDGTTNSSFRQISKEAMMAPVCFLAESLEASQASILERSVVAAFHKDATYGRQEHARFLGRHERNIGMLGWLLVQSVLECDLPEVVKLHDNCLDEAERLLENGNNHRVVENAAAVLTGFDYFASVIERTFPNDFSQKLDALRRSLTSPDRWLTRVASEIVRLLSILSAASYEPLDSRNPVCIKDRHYAVQTEEGANGKEDFLLVHIEKCFYLYRECMKHVAMQPAFNSVEEFAFALGNSTLAVDTLDYPPLGGRCVKISSTALIAEGVRMFRS